MKNLEIQEKLKKPKVHILLATFNRAQLIGETLDSILDQTYSNWECIIVDDFSSDNTKLVVEEYLNKDDRFRFYLKSENHKKGLSASRNYGLELAEKRGAEFIQFFDDDDIMHPKKLELQLEPFLIDPYLDLTICCYRKFDFPQMIEYDLTKADDRSCVIKTSNLLKGFFLHQINLNSPGPLWKAKILFNYRFNEKLFFAEERDFYLRIFLNESLNYKPIEKILFWYRKHDKAITSGLYEDEKIKIISEEYFQESFLNHILNRKKAPFFLLQSYFVQGIKTKKPSYVKSIKKYVLEKYGFNIEYIKLHLLSIYFRIWKTGF